MSSNGQSAVWLKTPYRLTCNHGEIRLSERLQVQNWWQRHGRPRYQLKERYQLKARYRLKERYGT